MPKRKVYEEKMKPGKLPLALTSKPTENQNEEHEEVGLVFISTTKDVHQQMRHLASTKRSLAIPFSN